MSFILDALKKAESERSRQAGPVLVEARLARARHRLPGWAWALGCILLANLMVLVWVLLRKPNAGPPAAAAPAATAPAAVPVAPPVVATPTRPDSAIQLTQSSPSPATVSTSTSPVPLNVGSLPTLPELLAAGISLPALQLNLHVYDEASANRYVLLNSKRVREGDEVTAGLRVELITPRGVVLDYQGRRFLMLAGG